MITAGFFITFWGPCTNGGRLATSAKERIVRDECAAEFIVARPNQTLENGLAEQRLSERLCRNGYGAGCGERLRDGVAVVPVGGFNQSTIMDVHGPQQVEVHSFCSRCSC